MKLKKLFAAALLVCSTGAWAQTDVTSTYLTNADFSEGPVVTADIRGYGKDMVSGDVYGFQNVTGWTFVVTSGDNSNNSYPNSGMAGAVLAYGSSNQLKGNNVTAPATGPDAGSGNGLGFFGVWGCGGYYYQDVTLAAGKYTITFPIYCISGTQANTTYTGFFPTSGTNRTVGINTTVGQWVNQTVTFTLTAETAGQIRVGYQSTGSGSGANPHLVFDGVKIEFTATVVKDVLSNALAAATTANAVLGTLTDAISTAQAVYDNASATQEQVNAAAATLNAAVELAMSAAGDVTAMFLTNAGFESCTEKTDNAAAGGSAAPLAIDGGWTQVSSAAWSSSAVVSYGGSGQVNSASAPSTDNAGNSGKTLGVSVGWGGEVTYQSAAITLPAGVYTLKVNAYNNLSGVTQFTSKFGFVPTEGAATMSTKKSFTYATWEEDKVTFTLNEATEGKIQVGGQAISGGSGSNAKVFFDNITIEYKSFLAGAKAAWDDAVTAAEEAKTANPNVVGVELTALNAELTKAEPTTVEGYETATEAIEAATATFTDAKANYDALVAEIAYAKTIGIASETADDYAATSESTAATALTSTQNLKVLEYTTINAAYANEVSSLLGEWNKGNYDTTSGQGYTGSETYFDKWSGSATDLTSSATVTLPAGKYVVKVAGRGVSTTTMNLSVKVGEADAVNTPFLMNGDTGKGIDTDGATNFSDGGTYSNSNIGRGWQYRYITFTTDGTAEVVISINGHLNGGTWQSFYAPVLLCDDATYAPIAVDAVKAELQAAIDAAPAVRTANIGDGAFQIKQAGVTAYSDALDAATAAKNAGDATIESINAAKTALATAIETYNNLEVNKPDAEKVFNIILTADGWTYDGKAITFLAGGNPTAGNYAIQYKEAPNTNLAQAFTFTKVEGNKYKMSQIDADGVDRYISTGVTYGGNTSQIRTVTEADKALLVEVIPTNVEGVYNLRNTEANNYIGSQDAGVYTVNSHIDFSIVETTKPSIAINTSEAGWGTTFLPFAVAALPTDVKAYTCAAVDVNTLTLVEVDALEANKPYIIEGSWNEILKGDAQGTELTHKEGLLTGTYAQIAAPNGSYILQNQNDKVGFYLVNTEKAQPNVPANRAYLTVGGDSSVKAFFLNDTATGINGVMNEIAAGKIYDLGGRKVSKMQKGQTYIVGDKKVTIK